MAAHMEERQKENAGADLKLDTQWWVPAINFGADIKETLDSETNDSFNACIGKLIDQKFSPDALAESRAAAEKILAGYPALFERVDEMIFQKQEIWAYLHEYAIKEKVGGTDVFRSIAPK
uniref:Shikimate kinase n=2 Tax=Talaromyces marneffei TaxID=37727 RepID=A0A093XCT8_TALMA